MCGDAYLTRGAAYLASVSIHNGSDNQEHIHSMVQLCSLLQGAIICQQSRQCRPCRTMPAQSPGRPHMLPILVGPASKRPQAAGLWGMSQLRSWTEERGRLLQLHLNAAAAVVPLQQHTCLTSQPSSRSHTMQAWCECCQ